MARGRRTAGRAPRVPTTFLTLLRRHLALAGEPFDGLNPKSRLRALRARGGGLPRWADDAVDAAIRECLPDRPDAAFAGAVWVAEALGAARRDGPERWVGEEQLFEAIAPVWGTLRAAHVASVALWELAAHAGEANRVATVLAVDGTAGAEAALRAVAHHTDSRQGPPFGHLEPDREIRAIRSVLRTSEKADGPPGGGTHPRALCAIEVAHVQTLRAFAGGHHTTGQCWWSRDDVHGMQIGWGVQARLGTQPLSLSLIHTAPEPVQCLDIDAQSSWAERQLPDHAVDVVPSRGYERGIVLEDAEAPVSWPEWPMHDLRERVRCTHPRGRWARNHSNTAIVLSCPDCGSERLALCWRDELPAGHQWHVQAGATGPADQLERVRNAIAHVGEVQDRHGGPWTGAMLDPAHWALPGARARMRPDRSVSPEAQLTRRRPAPAHTPR